ncbi:hypothetical protein KI809_12915 [Geobacter pelophilus]|jgi:hypothetical protein|uniref:Uncharacterized protein n=1 Tax=Geoanaerobacter pelophilus TaxID=60036 RepID=A0AAW4LDI8_9BACT|nr:hypothetical protein [Geoanaerobacter pelophilus]MBT0665201.1 hypothetical protein [Geoanaerobacter pelophilus]
MGKGKVIYLDEYRRARQYRSLLGMIERHLAEAGLLWDGYCLRNSENQGLEDCWQAPEAEEWAGNKDLS